jgi:excinuclease UvrABC nuclease subunit
MHGWCDGTLDLDPTLPLDGATKPLPARWAVYLMLDDTGRPVQLLSVKNLRASVRRRLAENPDAGISKRIDYRSLVRSICWKRVDSAFESDLVYAQVAREIFPDSYHRVTHWRQPWMVNLDLSVPFPRWKITDNPAAPGESFGPIAEKGQAQKLVETIEDLFDLCRYHHILQQSPNGLACPYKDMGKCPAPCDGSVSMQQYCQLLDWSLRTLRDPQPEIDQQADRMKAAAAELKPGYPPQG